MASKIAPSAAVSAIALATRLPAIRTSVRPLAVRWATMNAISTSVHNTMISAKPLRSRQGTADRAGISLESVRVGQAGVALALKLLRYKSSIDQLAAQILCQRPRVALIVDDVRGDQHEQFGAGSRVGLARN